MRHIHLYSMSFSLSLSLSLYVITKRGILSRKSSSTCGIQFKMENFSRLFDFLTATISSSNNNNNVTINVAPVTMYLNRIKI